MSIEKKPRCPVCGAGAEKTLLLYPLADKDEFTCAYGIRCSNYECDAAVASLISFEDAVSIWEDMRPEDFLADRTSGKN